MASCNNQKLKSMTYLINFYNFFIKKVLRKNWKFIEYVMRLAKLWFLQNAIHLIIKNLIVIEIRIIFRDLLMKAILNLQIIVNEKYFSTILRVKIRKELNKNNRRRLSHATSIKINIIKWINFYRKNAPPSLPKNV